MSSLVAPNLISFQTNNIKKPVLTSITNSSKSNKSHREEKIKVLYPRRGSIYESKGSVHSISPNEEISPLKPLKSTARRSFKYAIDGSSYSTSRLSNSYSSSNFPTEKTIRRGVMYNRDSVAGSSMSFYAESNLFSRLNMSLNNQIGKERKRKIFDSLKNDSAISFATSICSTPQPQPINSVAHSSSTRFPINCIITVDTSKARSNLEVLKMCIPELGWQECPDGLPNGCDIIWQSCTSHEGRDQFVNISQSASSRINKFPCMNQLLRKGSLTLALNVMRQVYEDAYDFYPRTWFLPEQYKEFSQDCKYIHEYELRQHKQLTTFIVKPNDGSQGDGICLINDASDYLNQVVGPRNNLNTSKSYIVQEYIHSPLLIDGLKFDLRIYVVILSLRPLSIYICDEGLVRFATVDYEMPNQNNLNQVYMHLTNYSLNKKNESYKFVSQITDEQQPTVNQSEKSSEQGSKRKLSKVYKYLKSKGHNINKLKSDIDGLVIKTIFALIPEMSVECAFDNLSTRCNKRESSFQILGFDILLRDDLKPLLLEVNCNPSLRVDYEKEAHDGRIINIPSPIDVEIKKPLVLETLKLAAPRKKQQKIDKIRQETELIEKENKLRDQMARQKAEEKLLNKKRERKTIDLDKCPLLSKPSKSYKKKLSQNESDSVSEAAPSEISISNTNLTTSSVLPRVSTIFEYSSNDNLVELPSSSSVKAKQKPCLRNIYGANLKSASKYEFLYLPGHIADIFVAFTLTESTSKYMSHEQFHLFSRKCRLISDKLSADNLDILYTNLIKKWEMYNRKKSDPAQGLCYQGFVDCFVKLAKLIFNESSLENSIRSMIYYCKYFFRKEVMVRPNQYFDMELTPDLYPLSEHLNKLIQSAEDPSILNKFQAKDDTIYYNIEYCITKAALSKSTGTNKDKPKKSFFPIFYDTST